MTKSTIQYNLLKKLLRSECSEKEKQSISVWSQGDSEREKFIEAMKRFESSGSFFNTNGTQKQQALLLVQKKIKRKKQLQIGSMVASILMVMGTGLFFYRQQSANNVPTTIAETKTTKPSINEIIHISPSGKQEVVSTSLSCKQQPKKKGKREETKVSIRLHKVVVPKGKRLELTLSDGTKVWINEKSELEYPEQFAHEQRVVKLKGEAYFDVFSNKKHPFVVKTENQEVCVLGTEFNLTTNKANCTETTLIEGSVRVTAGKKELQLVPGQQAKLNKKSQELTQQKANLDEVLAWRKNLYIFRNSMLEEIAKTLSDKHEVTIKMGDKKVGKLRFSGRIKRNLSLDAFLSILEETNELNITRVNDTIILTSKQLECKMQ